MKLLKKKKNGSNGKVVEGKKYWKKKRFIIPVAAMFIAISIASLSDETEDPKVDVITPIEEKVVEKKEEKIEVVKEETLEEKKVKDEKAEKEKLAKEEEEKIEAEKEKAKELEKAKKREEDDYSNKVSELSTKIGNDFSRMSKLLIEAGENPFIMSTNDWVIETAVSITQIDMTLNEINELVAPEKYAEADKVLKEAVTHFKHVPERLPAALDSMDVNEMNEITVQINLGNDKLEEATTLYYTALSK